MTTSSNRRFPWGPDFENGRCNIGNEAPAPIGRYSPAGDSPFGLVDVAGNVWQWTSSQYWNYPFDPKGRVDKRDHNGRRVGRGGAFNEPPLKAHCAWREWFNPASRRPNLGFRLACDNPG